jgi:dTDP-4-amino-4,6-dideoxygalactose transaminase
MSAIRHWPVFAADEIESVSAVMRSGKASYWTGVEGREFEREFAAWVGVPYAVALANGTVALECALKALGIGPGDEVVTTSRTFIASASCAAMLGARPVCADVDAESQNLTADSIRAVLSPRTKAIVAVHLAGWPCEMDAILEVAREHGLKVVEDCAQAHGATYKGRRVGSMGDVAAFSFCQDKIMTTLGEGGMVTTRDEALWSSMWSLKDHGKSYDAVYHRQDPPGFRWLHESFGTNWRMTEAQSAVGRLQLQKLPGWLEVRARHAAILDQELAGIPNLRLTLPPAHIRHAYYKYYTFIRPEQLADGWSRDRILDEIQTLGYACFSGSCSEIYLEKAFPAEWRPQQPLPVACELGQTSIMFQVHPPLDEAYFHDLGRAVASVMAKAMRS